MASKWFWQKVRNPTVRQDFTSPKAKRCFSAVVSTQLDCSTFLDGAETISGCVSNRRECHRQLQYLQQLSVFGASWVRAQSVGNIGSQKMMRLQYLTMKSICAIQC